MQYFAVIGFLFDDISFDELHFGAKFDAKTLPEFEDLAGTIPTVTGVVSILEPEAVLGSFGKKED